MDSLSEPGVGATRNENLLSIEADDREPSGMDQQVELARSRRPLPCLDYDACFLGRDSAHQPLRVTGHGLSKAGRFGLAQQDGEKHGSVDDHDQWKEPTSS